MNRKVLYGYQIEDGKLTLQPQEAAVVRRVFGLYLEGKLQWEISDTLNADGILYSPERPVWTKFRIGFILRNQRYIGVDGYPVLIDAEIFQSVQSKLQKKWGDHTRRDRPVSALREKLRCPCGGRLKRWFSSVHKPDTLQCLGGRLRQQGRRVIFIVPKKGHEFRPLCELLGGLYLKMSPSSKDCPNIMAIRRKSLDAYSGLRDLAIRDDSVLADKISRLIIWYSLQKRDLSDEDKNHLDSSLVECYRRYGITFDNETVTDTDGQFREMPIIADWYKVLQESPETKHLAVVLARYVTGSASAMGARNDIDLDNKYIVLDTSGMPDDLLLPGIFWATDIANDLIMDAGSDLSALIADELWSLVGANSNPLAAGFVQEMVKTIRGLGGIAVTSTQGMQDLFGLDGGKYGKGILDSSRIKLVMQMEEQEARLIQGVLNLSEDEVRQITRFRRGEGLLCIGYNRVPIAFHATQKEYDAITTSPTDLRVRRSGGVT